MSTHKKRIKNGKKKLEKCIIGRAAWVWPLPVCPGNVEEVVEGAAAAA